MREDAMVEDAAGAVEMLRAVLIWLDGQDLWKAAIDVDSAIGQLDRVARDVADIVANGLSDTLH